MNNEYITIAERIKSQVLLHKGLKSEYLLVKEEPNLCNFITSEGCWTMDLSEDFSDIGQLLNFIEEEISLEINFWPGELEGWEKTLNIDFSSYSVLIFMWQLSKLSFLTEEVVEKYISKWDLSSCKDIYIRYTTNNKNAEIILNMHLPKIERIYLEQIYADKSEARFDLKSTQYPTPLSTKKREEFISDIKKFNFDQKNLY